MTRLRPLALASAVFIAGCPGLLGDTQPYVAARLDATTPAPPMCPAGVSVEDLFARRCATSRCHDDARAGGLDLRAPGLAARLIGAPSTGCAKSPLADPEDPDGSNLYLKLFSEPPCGDRMPLGAPALSASEAECVRDWIANSAAAPDAGSSPDAAREDL